MVGDKQGWQITKKDTKLYEKLMLSKVDINVGDVIIPHIFDYYSDTDQNIMFDLPDKSIDKVYIAGYGKGIFVSGTRPTYVRASLSSGYVRIYLWSGDAPYAAFQANNGTAGDTLGLFPNIDAREWHEFAALFDLPHSKVIGYIDGAESSTGNLTAKYDLTVASVVYKSYKGWMAYGYVAKNVPSEGAGAHILQSEMLSLFEPTAYNGTYYIDIISKVTASGEGIRIPTENPFLWLVKSLENDNKLHFKWFLTGTIIKIKDSSGNIIREFTIDGTPANSDDQIEDYAVALDITAVSSATVEAYVPSFKVRVYAPYGSIVQIVDNEGNIVGEGKCTGEYVDIMLSKEVDNGQILILADTKLSKELDVSTSLNGNNLIVNVFDDGSPVPDMLVRVADSAGVVVASGLTDQSGQVEFELNTPLPEATIEVSGIWQYKLVYQTETIQLSNNVNVGNSGGSEQTRLLLLGLGIIAMIAAIIVFSTKGIKVRT